ncbi:5255_t:CDS:1, partial [Funneliformis caledonium]
LRTKSLSSGSKTLPTLILDLTDFRYNEKNMKSGYFTVRKSYKKIENYMIRYK